MLTVRPSMHRDSLIMRQPRENLLTQDSSLQPAKKSLQPERKNLHRAMLTIRQLLAILHNWMNPFKISS